KSELIRASKLDRKMTRLQVYFGSAMVGSVWLQVCLTGRAYCPIWPMPESELGQLLVGVVEMITMLVGCTGFYAAGALIGTLT
ncbi:Odorant receptor 35, partial [Frankliniella occidentalis]